MNADESREQQPLSGEDARKAWKAARSEQAKAARNQRGKRRTKKNPLDRPRPGMVRRMPPQEGGQP